MSPFFFLLRSERLNVPIACLALFLFGCTRAPEPPPVTEYKVAFAGDTGYDAADTPEIDTGFEKVLALVRDEGADLLVIPGDFSYEEDLDVASVYFANIDRMLGPDFPLLASDGNHDDWSHYEPFLRARLDAMDVPRASPLPVDYAADFGGIRWVLLGETGNAPFVAEQIAASTLPWRVCVWHKNMNDMQPGGKSDEMDWETYRACQDGGAMVITAHEHSYGRTMTLTDLGNVQAGHGATGPVDTVVVGPGRTFVVVSGLGGRSRRDYHCPEHDDDTWWASIYTSNFYLRNGETLAKSCEAEDEAAYNVVDGYTDGALFVTFNAGGDPYRAEAVFKTVDGREMDRFAVARH